MRAKKGAPEAVWTPVVDGRVGFLPRMPIKERRQGRFSHVPILAGVVHDEGTSLAKRNLKGMKLSLDSEFTEEDFHKAIHDFLNRFNVRFSQETFEELVFRYTWWSQPNNVTARKEQYIAVSACV